MVRCWQLYQGSMLLLLASLSLVLMRTSYALALVSHAARLSLRGGGGGGSRGIRGFMSTPPKLPLRQTTRRLWTLTTTTTSLNGISEWRDIVSVRDSSKIQTKELPPLAKEICVLPFPYQEVLLQGETKQLRLYEERFVQLFADCMEHHGGVVAMGLLASNLGLVQSVPLAEIEAYNHVPGFGIFCTLRVVARANLIDIVQETPYIKAICTELTDQVPSNLEEYVGVKTLRKSAVLGSNLVWLVWLLLCACCATVQAQSLCQSH
jgi:Lon protease-like protein